MGRFYRVLPGVGRSCSRPRRRVQANRGRRLHNGRTMHIQRLDLSHTSAYRALMLDAFALHPDAFTSSLAERAALPIAWWESRLASEPDAREVVFGAFVDGALAGVAGLSFEAREKARHKATLFGMYVPSGFRQHGVGRGLVAALLAFARAREGVEVVQLTVTSGNLGAEASYRSAGFVPFGVEPMAVRVGDTFVSKTHMWCQLSGPGA